MSDDEHLAVGKGLFLGGVISAVAWLVGYAAVVYFNIDLWFVGPAVVLLALGLIGLVVHEVATGDGVPSAEDLE